MVAFNEVPGDVCPSAAAGVPLRTRGSGFTGGALKPVGRERQHPSGRDDGSASAGRVAGAVIAKEFKKIHGAVAE
jgi:hypothetical protein